MAIVCPYCLNDINKNTIRRMCNICGHVSTERFGSRIPKCPEKGCLGSCSTLVCGMPNCGHVLPADLLQYEKYTRFAVVSHAGGGKTNYITTMLEELKRTRALQMFTSYMNTETQVYHSDNVTALYDRCMPIPPTPPGEIHPLQWRLQDLRRQTRSSTPAYSMTIFDGAGEDLEKTDPLVCRYLTGSKMILLLLDPTRLCGVRAQMTEGEIRGAGGNPRDIISRDETTDFVQGLINYIKTSTGVPVSKRIKQPIAVVFGKIDAVARLLGSARVLQPSGHAAAGAFVRSEAETVHREIEAFIDACGDDLNGMFNANFTQWMYFGVSSFGFLPMGGARQRPQPLRVLDPLMWDFSMAGIVPKK